MGNNPNTRYINCTSLLVFSVCTLFSPLFNSFLSLVWSFFSAVAAFYNCINRKQWKQRHRHYMYRASEWWNDTEPESQLIVNVGS